MPTIHFLSAADGTPLTKSFRMTDEGLQKDPYPRVFRTTSHEEQIASIEDLFDAISRHGQEGHCLLKGQLDRALRNESRAGHTDPSATTEWAVLDNDNLHDVEPQAMLDMLGLGHVDHVVQYSASAGVEPGKRGYHIFLLLDRPWRPSDLKMVLRAWNLDLPAIRSRFQLNASRNALRWPLDISVCQNDKLIYVAAPVLGPGVEDGLDVPRVQLVKRGQLLAHLPEPTESEHTLRTREQEVINRLRRELGLPPKSHETRTVGDQLVALNPDRATATGRKEERGFVYLNLNGGDSWGYYHPVTSPEILYNFKGEPNYLIQELLPDYYPDAKARASEAQQEQQRERQRAEVERQAQSLEVAEKNGGTALVAFRDLTTDRYHAGWINPQERTHQLNEVGTKARIHELFAQHGEPKPEIIPSVNFLFAPADDRLCDLAGGFVNRYTPSRYLKSASRSPSPDLPPSISRLISHALGDDPEVVEHFLNWLAVIFQHRARTQTGWILQGTTGTGKGLLFNEVIRPLVGEGYCRIVNLANLEDQFNGYAERTIVLFVDEVDTDQVRDMPKLMARFKSWITEPLVPLRAMRQDLREVPNHLNLLLSSNQPNSMRIEANDRRFNVCPRQEEKLLAADAPGEALVERLRAELPDFADYLVSRHADPARARRALDNEPKRVLQRLTQTAIEEVAEALRNGDLGYLFDHRPLPSELSVHAEFNGSHIPVTRIYCEALVSAIEAAERGVKHVLTHEEVFAIFTLLVGDMPKTKAKLKKRLGHQNVHIMPHTQGSSSVRGVGVRWNATPDELERWRQALADEEKKEMAKIGASRRHLRAAQ